MGEPGRVHGGSSASSVRQDCLGRCLPQVAAQGLIRGSRSTTCEDVALPTDGSSGCEPDCHFVLIPTARVGRRVPACSTSRRCAARRHRHPPTGDAASSLNRSPQVAARPAASRTRLPSPRSRGSSCRDIGCLLCVDCQHAGSCRLTRTMGLQGVLMEIRPRPTASVHLGGVRWRVQTCGTNIRPPAARLGAAGGGG
jgi:hypothetical protein